MLTPKQKSAVEILTADRGAWYSEDAAALLTGLSTLELRSLYATLEINEDFIIEFDDENLFRITAL